MPVSSYQVFLSLRSSISFVYLFDSSFIVDFLLDGERRFSLKI
uniref:Uncharacterized protein n=1 Tax=Rhizophora mucronata TaxID=61149 RepID=A0A2P2R3H2_RHIMU